MGSMSTQTPFPNVSRRSRAEPQGQSRSLLVTHSVARSRQFSPPGHLQAFAVFYTFSHRFALSRQRFYSRTPPLLPFCLMFSPTAAGATALAISSSSLARRGAYAGKTVVMVWDALARQAPLKAFGHRTVSNLSQTSSSSSHTSGCRRLNFRRANFENSAKLPPL